MRYEYITPPRLPQYAIKLGRYGQLWPMMPAHASGEKDIISCLSPGQPSAQAERRNVVVKAALQAEEITCRISRGAHAAA